MRKYLRAASLVLALFLLASLPVMASGEASGESFNTAQSTSGEAESTAIFTVDGQSVTEKDGLFALTGEIGADHADGIDLTISDFTASGIQVTGGEYRITNSVITHSVSEATETTTAGGYCAGVTDGLLIVENSTLIAEGKGGVFGNYTIYCAENGTLVVINSDIIQLGTAGDPDGLTDAISEPPSNGGLLISGYSRANMSMGVTTTYYYGSYVETDGWAAMSTDMTRSLDFYAYDSVGKAIHGGYGTYADSSCRDYFYGSVLSGAELGAIISNNGEIHLASLTDAPEEALVYLPADYTVSDDCQSRGGRSLVEGGRNGIQIHSPEESKGTTRGMTAIVKASDTDFLTTDELAENATLVDWSTDYGPAVAEYIDLVDGAIFLVKSAYADIDLTDCGLDSKSGTILMTAVNSDSMSCYALNTHDMTGRGTVMTLRDCTASGDVKAYDYQRNCTVNLVNTTWSGAYETWNQAQWNAVWSDDARSDELCYWILDGETYHDGTGNGSALTLDAGSTWNVTGNSQLVSLTVDAGGIVNGIVTVDGVVVDTSTGGTWSGDILVTPVASGEAS